MSRINTKVYIIGSLRNPEVINLGNKIRDIGFNVFEDWIAAGPEADDYWQEYEQKKGSTYKEALRGNAAEHVFFYDKSHLDSANIGILMLPAGKSGHLELGYMLGQGKKGYILLDGEPERWDVMYRFATEVFTDEEELLSELSKA